MRKLLFCLVGVYLLWVFFLPGCSFGLIYSGNEDGLHRQAVVSRDGHELSYLVAGDDDDPRVIFIHGSPGQGVAYCQYLHEPVGRHEMVAVDRLGYGFSKAAGSVVSFADQAAAIAPLLVKRDGRWPIVVGHSLGAPIAARLAAEYPDRVGGLILIGGPMDPKLERLRWYNSAADVAAVSLTLDEKLRVSNREMLSAREELQKLEPLLERIVCPITVIHGTRDSLVPYRNVEFLVRKFGGNQAVRVVTLYGEDHFITRQRPEVVREAIQDMAERITPLERGGWLRFLGR
jgi:pimeloyl-ACP methyl ester carboxylesterase